MQKKVLFIVTSTEIGGAQKFVKEQVEILYQAGYLCYLTSNEDGWLNKVIADKIQGLLLYKSIKGISLFYLVLLTRFICKNKINLVICNSANGGLYGRLAALLARSKSIYISHGWSSVYNGGRLSFLYNKIELLLSYISNGIMCVSNNDFNTAINKIGISKNKLTTLSNCIFPVYRSDKMNTDRIEVLTVSRLSYPKRVDLLVEGIKDIKEAHLTVIGDGSHSERIRNIIQKQKITNVTMLGEIDNFNEFYRYDIFVLISESEGLPLSALEAMSAGLALVISNVGGCSELINNNGYLVDNVPVNINSAIRDCINNLRMYKSHSILLFNEKYNLVKRKDAYIKYYQEIIDSK